jgi:hypothetical protein
MSESLIQRTFAGGELAPELHARADQAKYVSGLRTCKNFQVRKGGGVSNRGGYRFVDAAKDAVAGKKLLRYVSSTAGGSVLIEAGIGYLRFFHNGAAVLVTGVPAYNNATAYVPGDLVVSAAVNYYCKAATTGNAPPNGTFWYPLTGAIYEIPTPYGSDPLFQWNQSGNVITLTHPSTAPYELQYTSLTRWVLAQVTTGAGIAAPVGGAGVAGAAGARTFRYVVTAVAASTFEEGTASGVITIAAAAEPTAAAPNQLTWTAMPSAAEFNIYADPYGNSVFGFIGSSTTASFNDVGQTPDFDLTPTTQRTLFATTNNFPTTSAVYQQRQFFANTNTEPDRIDASQVGFRHNFGISSPLQDGDSITIKLAGNNQHAVRHMVATRSGLVVMTDGGEWTVTGGGGPKNPISPNSISADQETYVGIDPDVQPVVVGNAILYLQARGSTIYDLKFEQQVEGLAGRDLTVFATHLFDERRKIIALDYQQVPHSILWCVRDDGVLLGLTYLPEQELWGWHRHTTQQNTTAGVVEDVCVVPEETEDVVYLLVKRTINGADVRYIERLENREIRTASFDVDAFFVDCGLSYSGLPANNFSGLDHLEGQVVAVLGDGAVVFNGDPTSPLAPNFTVTAGEITLAADYSNVHIGLAILYPDLETLDLDVQGANIRDKKKSIHSVVVLVHRSSRSFWIGPDEASLRQVDVQAWEGAADETTGQIEVVITADYNENGRLLLRQKDPLPLTVLGIIPNVELGG